MGSVGHATTEARVLKRLPKRIRLDLGNKTSTGSVAPSLNSTPLGISGSGQQLQRGLLHSDAESTPALDSPDTTSAENDEELLPSTPPELSANSLHQAHYQPLFAPVDHIVKQAALGTTLFGPAVQVYNKPNNTAPLAHDRSPTPVLPTATDDAEGEGKMLPLCHPE